MSKKLINILIFLVCAINLYGEEYRIRVGDKVNVTMKEDEEVKI